MEKKGLSQDEMSMRLGVSRTAFAGWFRERISLRHLVAICIAADVRADIGMDIVRLGGYSFMATREQQLMVSFLYETKDITVARANEMMREGKLKPLTEGASEELAEVK